LLVHLAAVDGNVTDDERAAVRNALMDYYALDEGDVTRLIAEATRKDAESVDFYRFTSALASLDEDDRVEIVRMMWQVVFADKQNHELEDNMVWRIAELIGVSARQRYKGEKRTKYNKKDILRKIKNKSKKINICKWSGKEI